jgi:hypothetical protein
MLTTLILWAIGCSLLVYAVCKHFIHTREFNPLFFTLDKEVQEAEKRGIKPIIKPYKPPFTHYLYYYFGWLVLAVIFFGVTYVIWKWIN